MDAAIKAGREFGYPLMIKSRKMAYDGRGNAVAHSVDKLAEAVQVLGGFERGLYAEKWAPFEKVKSASSVFFLLSHCRGLTAEKRVSFEKVKIAFVCFV
jgi:phosphoribosylaminoimidazole carboxylase (NCAIR synthetase)